MRWYIWKPADEIYILYRPNVQGHLICTWLSIKSEDFLRNHRIYHIHHQQKPCQPNITSLVTCVHYFALFQIIPLKTTAPSVYFTELILVHSIILPFYNLLPMGCSLPTLSPLDILLLAWDPLNKVGGCNGEQCGLGRPGGKPRRSMGEGTGEGCDGRISRRRPPQAGNPGAAEEYWNPKDEALFSVSCAVLFS